MNLEKSFMFSKTCPNCKTIIRKNVLSTHEVLAPYDRFSFSDIDKRFKVKCPSCGLKADLAYPFRYIDRISKYELFLIPIGHPDEEELLNGLSSCNENPDYVTRLVADDMALLDKINVFNAGLNDKVIELCKVLMWGDLCEQQPKYKGANLVSSFYMKHEKDGSAYSGVDMVMQTYEKGGKRDSDFLILERDYFDNIFNQCKIDIDAQPIMRFDEINASWAHKVFKSRRERLGLT